VSIHYHIDHEQRLVIATPREVLTDADMFDYQREVWSRPDTRGYNELVDMTGVSQIEFASADRMTELAALSKSMDSPSASTKLAIVAADNLHFGLGRMYETYRHLEKKGNKEVSVFRTRREALQWLGVGSR